MPLDPWLVGLHLGDGDQQRMMITTTDDEIEAKMRDITVKINESKPPGLEPVKLKVDVNPPRLNNTIKENRPTRSLSITVTVGNLSAGWWNPIPDIMRDIGVKDNHKSLGIPESYLNGHEVVQLQTLAGLADSDGSLDKKGRYSDGLVETCQDGSRPKVVALLCLLSITTTRRQSAPRQPTSRPTLPTPLHPPSSYLSLSSPPSRPRLTVGPEQSAVLATMQGNIAVGSLPTTVALRDVNNEPIWVTVGPLYRMNDPYTVAYWPREDKQGPGNIDNMTTIIVDSHHLLFGTATSKTIPLYRSAGTVKKNAKARVGWTTPCQPFAGSVAASDGAHGLIVDQTFLDDVDSRLQASKCLCGGARGITVSFPSNAAAKAFHDLMTGLLADLVDPNIIRPGGTHLISVLSFAALLHAHGGNEADGSITVAPGFRMTRYPIETLPAEGDDTGITVDPWYVGLPLGDRNQGWPKVGTVDDVNVVKVQAIRGASKTSASYWIISTCDLPRRTPTLSLSSSPASAWQRSALHRLPTQEVYRSEWRDCDSKGILVTPAKGEPTPVARVRVLHILFFAPASTSSSNCDELHRHLLISGATPPPPSLRHLRRPRHTLAVSKTVDPPSTILRPSPPRCYARSRLPPRRLVFPFSLAPPPSTERKNGTLTDQTVVDYSLAQVGDLITSPRVVYRFWLVQPLESVIFFAAVFVSIFSSLENGVYTSVAASLALLLIRVAKPRISWLGTVDIRHGDDSPTATQTDATASRLVFVPLDDRDGMRDPSIRVLPPPPGVLMLRFEEAFTYPNASALTDVILDHVKTVTRPGKANNYARPGDRPWNDPGPLNPLLAKSIRPFTFSKAKRSLDNKIAEAVGGNDGIDNRPVLRALVLDFSGVSNVDTTSTQNLVDLRVALERYAGDTVEFHFASILSPWIRRALLAGSFGIGNHHGHIIEIAPVVSGRNALSPEEDALRRIEEHTRRRRQEQVDDKDGSSSADRVEQVDVLEMGASQGPSTPRPASSRSSTNKDRLAEEGALQSDGDDNGDGESAASVPILWGSELVPAFHLDLSSALAAATAAARKSRD